MIGKLKLKTLLFLKCYKVKESEVVISEIKRIAKRENFNTIIVGTPDCGFKEIKFYEQNGFTKYDIKKRFFCEKTILNQ